MIHKPIKNRIVIDRLLILTSVFLLLSILSLFMRPACAATLINDWTAETGTVGQCVAAPLGAVTVNCVKVTNLQASSGTKSYDVFLARDGTMDNQDSNTWYRTEAKGVASLKLEKTYALRYDFFFDEWDNDTSSESFPGQSHETPGKTDGSGQSAWDKWHNNLVQPGDKKCVPSAFSSATYFIDVESGNLRFFRYGGVQLWSKPVVKNVWHKLVIYTKISRTNGFTRTFYDGVEQPSFVGKNHRAESDMPAYCGFVFIDDNVTMGIYKWDWKPGQTRSQTQRRRAFIDNVKVAEETGTGTDALTLVGGTGPLNPVTDTIAPVISVLSNSNITTTSATVSWTVNESAKHELTINGVTYTLNNAFMLNPVFNVTGLPAGTALPYTLKATDAAGNVTNSSGTLTTQAVPTLVPVTVNESFFGMHSSTVTLQPWPTSPFKTYRTWDHFPGATWASINTSSGVYNWATLDAIVAAAQANGADIIYTFGSTPAWASTNPGGTGCAYGNGTCYAPNTADWNAFVTAITTRYAGKIKYWELWNEPNATNFWQGTTAQLVTMAQAAYPIIKAAHVDNKVLSPAPQGTNSHVWLGTYFAAGGSTVADIVAFHSYLNGAPENVVALTANVKTTANQYPALVGKPVWDTEHSWGDTTWPFGANEDQQAAWTARLLALSVSSGIDRSIWYKWDGYDNQIAFGMLFNRTQNLLLKPGIAYNNVHAWLLGATMEPCTLASGVYQCHLTRTGGHEALMVWASSPTPTFTAPFTVPTGYVKYKNLDNVVTNTTSGSVLTLTMKPILLENDPTPPDTTPPVITANTPMNVTDMSMTLNWTTDEPATTRVKLTPATVPSYFDGTLTLTHGVTLTGLLPDTLYEYKITSVDAANNMAEFVATIQTLPSALSAPVVSLETPAVADEFNGTTFGAHWTQFDTKANSTFNVANGHADIGVIAGSVHNMILTDTTAPRIRQPIVNGDFDVYVKFDALPSLVQNYTGFAFEKSPTDMLFFLLSSNGTNVAIEEKWITPAATTLRNKLYLDTIPPKYIRVKRVGNVFNVYTSNDLLWTKIDTFTFVQDINTLSMFTANWGSPLANVTAFTSSFDWLRFYANSVISAPTAQAVTHCVARVNGVDSPAYPVEAVAGGNRCNIPLSEYSTGDNTMMVKYQKLENACITESAWSLPITFSVPNI